MPPPEGPEKRTLTGPKMKPVTKTHMSIAKKNPHVDHPPWRGGSKCFFGLRTAFFGDTCFF